MADDETCPRTDVIHFSSAASEGSPGFLLSGGEEGPIATAANALPLASGHPPSSYSVANVRLLLPFVGPSGVVAGEGRPVYGR
jgi:hypothetical protein